jgi:ArsR family transcriptional regulator
MTEPKKSPSFHFPHPDAYYENISNIINALSHPIRLKIIEILKMGPLCVCKIEPEFNITQAAISKHLKIMVEAGILEWIPEGTKNIYSIKNPKLLESILDIETLIDNSASSEKKVKK